MKVIKPSIEIMSSVDGIELLKKIEECGRVCYKSEEKITENSATGFIEMILERGHETVIEHYSITVRVICDRGVSHEIVRHRIASYSQESTRYCNYSKDKFGRELTFIEPCFWNKESDASKIELWKKSLEVIEENYLVMIDDGASPQEARSILPNSLKTEIVMTMNLREWRHFLRLRTSKSAHPQMQEIASMIKNEFNKTIPLIFDDIL